MLTVDVGSSTYDLTVLKTVKAELKITDGKSNDLLSMYIRQASGVCANYCNRVFAKETVTETLWDVRRKHIALERYPVTSIASVTADGSLLDPSLYKIDSKSGLLYRMSGSTKTSWCVSVIEVKYTGGFDLLGTVPHELERAAIELVKLMHFAGARDPAVKSIDIPGVMSKTYWVGGDATDPEDLPPAVTQYLAPFRRLDAALSD